MRFFLQLYEIEREVHQLDSAERQRIRQERARPVAETMHLWLTGQRQKVPEGSATAKAIDYSLGRWQALTRYIDDGDLPADNNWVETKLARLRSEDRTGCSSDRFVQASAPLRS